MILRTINTDYLCLVPTKVYVKREVLYLATSLHASSLTTTYLIFPLFPSFGVCRRPPMFALKIKRLHRDMANMLATASSPPSTPHTSRVVSTVNTSSSSILPATRGSPADDSEDDYSDDEPALAVLRDDLRNTSEKFFERVTPPRGGQRRRSSSVAAKAVVAANEAHSNRKSQGLRQQQSWHGLNALTKGMGQDFKRRGSGTSSVTFQSRQGGGSGPITFSKHVDVSDGVQGGAASPSGEGEMQGKQLVLGQLGGRVGGKRTVVESKYEIVALRSGGGSLIERPAGLPFTHANKQRWSHAPATDDTSCHSTTASLTGWEYGGETLDRGSAEGELSRKQSKAHGLEDLRTRSEEATRTLEALKLLLVEEGRSQGIERSNRMQGQAAKLWPTRSKSILSKQDGSVEGVDRMPLLLQAMENLQEINAELNKALRKQSAGRRHGSHRKNSSASALLQQQHGPRRREVRSRQIPGQLSAQGLLARQPRSSSDLLQRRRFEKGQSEPMSCGVPRYRTQVNKRGDEKVYFELAITQARSTWTVERRVSEFLDLRRSLVKSATDLAAAAAQRQKGGSSSRLSSGRAQRRSQGAQKEGGKDGGSSASDGDYRRAGECRVPQITIDTGNWFERSRLGAFFSPRKREEKLAEKQVLLASWLAKVFADRELMSPELVRFLGGDGNVLAQPIVTENVILGDDGLYTNAGFLGQGDGRVDEFFESTESEEYDSSEEEEDDSESDTDDDLRSPLDGLHGSLVVPDEWALAALATNGGDPGSARGRLEAAMGKRAGVVARRSGSPPVALMGSPQAPKFPDVAQMMSLGKKHPAEGGAGGVVMKRWGIRDGGQGAPMVVERVISPKGETRRASDDPAQRQPMGPSPSSPTRRMALDAFFQAPP